LSVSNLENLEVSNGITVNATTKLISVEITITKANGFKIGLIILFTILTGKKTITKTRVVEITVNEISLTPSIVAFTFVFPISRCR